MLKKYVRRAYLHESFNELTDDDKSAYHAIKKNINDLKNTRLIIPNRQQKNYDKCISFLEKVLESFVKDKGIGKN